MGVRTLHIDDMSKSVGFLMMGGNLSVAAASAVVIIPAFYIFGRGGVMGLYYVVLL